MPKENQSPKFSLSRPAKLALAVAGVAIVGGLAAWKFKKAKATTPEVDFSELEIPDLPSPTPTTRPTLPPTSTGSGSTSFRPDNFPLSVYTKGKKVKGIQATLNQRFSAGLKVDGYWGSKTQTALQRHGQPTRFHDAAALEKFFRGNGSAVNSWNKWATGLGLAPPGLRVIALEDTVIWNGDRLLETVDHGQIIGTHVSTQNGVTEIISPEGARAFVKTIHVSFS